MPSSRRVHTLRPRTIGWGGRWWEETQWPGWLYYPARGYWWSAKTHPVVTGILTALVVLWALGGQAGILLVVAVVGVLGVSRVFWSTIAGGDRPTMSLADRKEQLLNKRTPKRQWPIACESARLLGTRTGRPPNLSRLASGGPGVFTATVRCGPLGITVDDFLKHSNRISQVVGCREVVVDELRTGIARLTFHYRDPIGRLLPLEDLPVSLDGLAYGVRQDVSVASVRPTESILIGGLTRKGKSNFVWALLADALRQGMHIDLYVSDPKGGVELDQLEAAVGRKDGMLRVRRYAKSAEETVEMIEAAEKAMGARQRWMKANGTRKIVPDEKNPLVVIILDETLPLTDILKRGTDSPLGRIAYTGAAAGYVVWANTQVAQIDAIGRFRDLIPQRVCFATGSPDVTDSVLGKYAESRGAECSRIKTPGVGYSWSEGDSGYQKFRAAMVTDAETRFIAAGKLPPKLLNKAQEAYDRAEEARSNVGVKSVKNRRTALYRWFYVNDPEYGNSLGYVGISYDVLRREQEHTDGLRAFMEGDVRRKTKWYPTRAEAEAAEELAIKLEKPIWNRMHNQGNKNRRKDRIAG